jgi:ADP-ribose pyrophosphatase YjhB (NUDIX family)
VGLILFAIFYSHITDRQRNEQNRYADKLAELQDKNHDLVNQVNKLEQKELVLFELPKQNDIRELVKAVSEIKTEIQEIKGKRSQNG